MTTEERLQKLEQELAAAKQRSRLLIGFAVCLGCAFAWGFLAQPGPLGSAQAQGPTTAPVPKEIRARLFILEDEAGKTRAELGIVKEGTGLCVFDENGKVSAVMETGNDGPVLTLRDDKGKTRAAMTVTKDGPSMGLFDENAKPIWKAPLSWRII